MQFLDIVLTQWWAISVSNLQLIGVVCLFFAAKCHETMVPTLDELLIFFECSACETAQEQAEYTGLKTIVMKLEFALYYVSLYNLDARA